MPSTVNGVGTHYRGRSRVHVERGECEHCHGFTDLTSYDTRLWFVVFFIPLLPLGRKRILSQCASCTRHRVVSLSDWEEAQSKAQAEAEIALQSVPAEPAKLVSVLQSANLFLDQNLLDRAAPPCREAGATQPEVLVFLAHTYGRFGRWPEAEQSLRAALQVRDDASVQEFLAEILVRAGRSSEAQLCLQHIIDQRLGDRLPYLVLLVKGFQAEGRHREALAVLEAARQALPAAASQPHVQALDRVSRKHADSGKPVASALHLHTCGPPPAGFSLSRRGKIILGLGLLALLSLYIAATIHRGNHRKVWLLNGLISEYAVDVNGQSVTLAPASPIAIEIPEGDVTIRVLREDLDLPLVSCRVETPFWSRVFTDPTFIINPDRVGILLVETVTYGNYRGDARPGFRVQAAKVLHEVTVDLPFSGFPASLYLKSGESAVRTRVIAQDPHEVEESLGWAEEQGGEVGMKALARAQMLADCDHETWLGQAVARVGVDDFLKLIEPRLAQRPVRVEAHRLYQAISESVRPGIDLESEYRALAAAEPNDPALEYLAARVIKDPDESDRRFEHAAAAQPPSPHALFEIGLRRQAEGKFAEALAVVEQAIQLEPTRRYFVQLQKEALLGLQRYAVLLHLNAAQQQQHAWDGELVEEEIRLRFLGGQKSLAAPALAYVARLTAAGESVGAAMWRRYLAAQELYLTGDTAGYARELAELEGAGNHFQAALTLGQWADCAKILRDEPGFGPYHHLLLYVAAEVGGDAVLADEELRQAVQGMRANGHEERWVAESLLDRVAPGLSRVTHCAIGPWEERILLTALGVRFPPQRAQFFELARRLNYDPQFPKRLLDQVLAED